MVRAVIIRKNYNFAYSRFCGVMNRKGPYI